MAAILDLENNTVYCSRNNSLLSFSAPDWLPVVWARYSSGMTRQSDSSIVFRWKKPVKFARALHRDSVPLSGRFMALVQESSLPRRFRLKNVTACWYRPNVCTLHLLSLKGGSVRWKWSSSKRMTPYERQINLSNAIKNNVNCFCFVSLLTKLKFRVTKLL